MEECNYLTCENISSSHYSSQKESKSETSKEKLRESKIIYCKNSLFPKQEKKILISYTETICVVSLQTMMVD